MSHLEELRAAVESNTTVVNSVIELISGLTEKLEHINNSDEAKELAAQLRADVQKLADAVAANTPEEE